MSTSDNKSKKFDSQNSNGQLAVTSEVNPAPFNRTGSAAKLKKVMGESFVETENGPVAKVNISKLNIQGKREFDVKLHEKFFSKHLSNLPCPYAEQDSIAMTFMFFITSGLDVLKCDSVVSQNRSEIIEWVYARQVQRNPEAEDYEKAVSGFCGDMFNPHSDAFGFTSKEQVSNLRKIYEPHLVHTWAALSILLICNDDLKRVDRVGIFNLLEACQKENGRFAATPYSEISSRLAEGDASEVLCESDIRFSYAAAAICFILNKWTCIDLSLCENFVLSCLTHEGGFSQVPGGEAHGGSTYCALATLKLINPSIFADDEEEDIFALTRQWLVNRQNKIGINGRPNKPEDSCYLFWISASLELLHIRNLLSNIEEAENYAFDAEDRLRGGYAKWPDSTPDLLHSYLTLAGCSIIGGDRIGQHLRDIHPALNITQRTFQHLMEIRKKE